MNVDTYKSKVRDYLLARTMTLEVANSIAELLSDASENSGDIYVDSLEEEIFGKRVECPKCGSLVLPEFECWGCDEWSAPKAITPTPKL